MPNKFLKMINHPGPIILFINLFMIFLRTPMCPSVNFLNNGFLVININNINCKDSCKRNLSSGRQCIAVTKFGSLTSWVKTAPTAALDASVVSSGCDSETWLVNKFFNLLEVVFASKSNSTAVFLDIYCEILPFSPICSYSPHHYCWEGIIRLCLLKTN
ncbi:hypothetical protein FF38_09086 [Lucilia cuprina]|uniref:Uncharacterized protein n=1 Tax=Lucilia cuprina TaxID=7375 RepID=A0A0L0C7R4_LUCCU|nr:hypothetical protein FF38_09086 [Lucilia cuprina]